MSKKVPCFPIFDHHVIEGVLYFYPVANLEAIWDLFERPPGDYTVTSWYANDHIKRHGTRIGVVSEMRACSELEGSCEES